MAKTNKNKIPSTALLLGFAGLIPFITSAVASVLLDAPLKIKASFVLAAYGAVILSFLGGVKWGVALNDKLVVKQWRPLVMSVLPSIVAWFSLLLPPQFSLSVLAIAFLSQYYLDNQSVLQGTVPVWYGRLRLYLTTGAVLSLLLALVALVI